MALIGYSMFLIWVTTVPLFLILVYLLADRFIHWFNGTISSFAMSLATDSLLLWSFVVIPINLFSLGTVIVSYLKFHRYKEKE